MATPERTPSMWRCTAGFVLLLLAVAATASRADGARRDRGSIVVLDAASGRETATLAANGAVVAAVSDGRGGWFVGGSFTRLGGRREVGLAHILATGSVDRSWRSRVGSASGRPVAVYALARTGSRLFVAGPFARVGGLHRPGLAAVDAGSGQVLATWVPRPLLWQDVSSLVVAGPRLLVAGQFSYPTSGVAALSIRSGAVDRRWNPHFRLIGDAGSFNALLLHRSRVYVAGSFHVSGVRRNGLVALGVREGKPDRRWAPQVSDCSVCRGFAVLYGLAGSGRRIYVSGAFRRVNGFRRDGIVALDPATGAVDPHWRPARGGLDVLHLVLAGRRLYVGGMSGVWALRASTGSLLPLTHLRAPRQVLALTLSGGAVLVAGRS
jgi:hypothetical protein